MNAPADHDETLADQDVGARVVRGGLQRSAGFVLTNVLALVGAVVLLRYLGVEDFGRYGVVMALVSIVYGISDAGLTLTGSRELAVRSEASARRELLANVLTLRVLVTATGVGAAVAFAGVAGYESELVLGVALAGFGIFLASIQAAMLLPLAVRLSNARVALNDVLHQAALVTTFAALAVLSAGLVSFFGAHIVVGVVLLSVAPLLLRREDLVAPRWSPDSMRALIRLALPIAVANVLGVLYVRILVVLMSLLSDDAREIGYFVTSTRVVELLASLPALLGAVILPVLTVAARDNQQRMRYMAARMTEAMALGGVLIAMFVAFAALPIVTVLGGSEYEGAVAVLQIQCLALVTLFLAASWNQALIGMGHVRALVGIIAAGLATVLVAGLVLIPAFDATGAAAAAVIADVALCVASYAALRRAGPGREFSMSTLARIAVATLPAIAVGLIPGVPPIVSAIAAALVFVGGAIGLKAVPDELLHPLRGLLRPGP